MKNKKKIIFPLIVLLMIIIIFLVKKKCHNTIAWNKHLYWGMSENLMLDVIEKSDSVNILSRNDDSILTFETISGYNAVVSYTFDNIGLASVKILFDEDIEKEAISIYQNVTDDFSDDDTVFNKELTESGIKSTWEYSGVIYTIQFDKNEDEDKIQLEVINNAE